MPKVKVLDNFIGRPEEVAQNKGQVPSNVEEQMKKAKKELSQADIDSFDHIISRGSTIEVTEKRAEELAKLGLVEYKKITPETAAAEEQAARDEAEKERLAEEQTNEKLQVNIRDEKSKNTGPNAAKK